MKSQIMISSVVRDQITLGKAAKLVPDWINDLPGWHS
jgi:hypothetical protein